MATRNGTKTSKTEVKAVGESTLIYGYRERAVERSKKNEELMLHCGVMSVSEFATFRDKMLDAYVKASKTSGPVINMSSTALLSFLKDNFYKGFGESGSTNGTDDKILRQEYSKRTYGYDTLESAEKYGTIPVMEVCPESPIRECPFCKRPGSRYGTIQVHLKSDVGMRTTMNLLDSSHQWGPNGSWQSNGCGWLFPVPYRVKDPEQFVGCLMAAPTPGELVALKETGPRADMFADNIRRRNKNLLLLLQGMDGVHYVEAHIHGKIAATDIDHIVYDPKLISDFKEWEEIVKFSASSSGVRPITYLQELLPNINSGK